MPRHLLSLLALIAFAFAVVPRAEAQHAQNLVDSILNDPAAPIAGDPHGDVTIVAFLDYNCPYCRRATPELARFIASDRHVKLIYKDWPILAPSSIVAAKVALAANYQNKYQVAHEALMAIKLDPATQASIKQAMETAGIDLKQLKKDLAAHNDAISALLQRNNAQADALHLQGTPAFLVGPYLIAGSIDEAGLRKLVAKLRAAK
ncbi:MAG: DsbA family protein [Methylovirgula sp.]|nr:DsbA family protein [Methylovirgula sp.]